MTRKRLPRVVLLLAAILVAAGSIFHILTAKNRLRLRIGLEQTEYELGDEISVRLEIENFPNRPFPWDKPRWYERLPFFSGKYQQRFSSYESSLMVRGPDGLICIPPSFRARRSSESRSETGNGIVCTLNLNDFALIGKPGTYATVGTFTVNQSPERSALISLKSRPVKIVVKPRTEEEMSRYIAGLAQSFYAAKSCGEETLLLRRMMYTRNTRILSEIWDCEYEAEGRTIPRATLLGYLPIVPETKEVILAEVKKRGLTETTLKALRRFGCTEEEFKEAIRTSLERDDTRCQKAAIQATPLYPESSDQPRLIELASDPNSPIRKEAMAAITINPGESGLKALERLTVDPDKHIARLADSALKLVKRRSSPLPVLPANTARARKIDKRKIAAAADPRNPERWNAVRCLFGMLIDEDYAAVAELADNPESAGSVENRNRAVKIISGLLTHPDKDVRDFMTTLIRLDNRELFTLSRMLLQMEDEGKMVIW